MLVNSLLGSMPFFINLTRSSLISKPITFTFLAKQEQLVNQHNQGQLGQHLLLSLSLNFSIHVLFYFLSTDFLGLSA
jgi:hypothetical protein